MIKLGQYWHAWVILQFNASLYFQAQLHISPSENVKVLILGKYVFLGTYVLLETLSCLSERSNFGVWAYISALLLKLICKQACSSIIHKHNL